MRKALKTVSVHCPVCLTGNRFNLASAKRELTCEDCGFLLADASAFDGLASARCIICGNDRFYFESPLNLKFLGRAATCYVCEAQYKGIAGIQPDAKYSDATAESLLGSGAARSLKERSARWH
jgi:hypothetical protein